jgi:hypothetical protein
VQGQTSAIQTARRQTAYEQKGATTDRGVTQTGRPTHKGGGGLH